MKLFTELYLSLDRTTKTSLKVAALRDYFRAAPPADAAWALHFLVGRRFRRTVTARSIRSWAAEAADLPAWLVDECHDAVGDLAEALALLLGDVPHDRPATPPLHEVVETRIAPLASIDEGRRRTLVLDTWRCFDAEQRLVWHKLIMGSFRVGVARTLVTRALAEAAGIEPAIMAHRLAGQVTPTAEAFVGLLAAEADGAEARPYPFFLAHPLETDVETLGDATAWQAEWKLDGIRAQIVRRGDTTLVWSRGEERINDTFPEIAATAALLPAGTALDGEVIAWEGERPAPFQMLQRRLGRKDVQPALWTDVPVVFVAFDLLEHDGDDIRAQPLRERRSQLERLVTGLDEPVLRVSPPLTGDGWAARREHFDRARDHPAEGLVLKRLDAPYRVGRVRGDWWKWKVDPYTIDAVLMYAEQGHGKRAGLFTAYTFGVWEGGELVPVARAYSGLTDEEIRAVDRHLRRTTVGRHGPVRVVRPELVFELAFESVQVSTRHKSGLALRFPRMARWRRDLRPKDADGLTTLRGYL